MAPCPACSRDDESQREGPIERAITVFGDPVANALLQQHPETATGGITDLHSITVAMQAYRDNKRSPEEVLAKLKEFKPKIQTLRERLPRVEVASNNAVTQYSQIFSLEMDLDSMITGMEQLERLRSIAPAQPVSGSAANIISGSSFSRSSK